MIIFTYRDKGTLIHRLNPVCKLSWFLVVVVLALLFDHPLHLSVLLVAVLAVIVAARVGREWASLMPLFLFFSLTLLFINALIANSGSHILWDSGIKVPGLGVMVITLEGVVYALLMSLRLLLILSAFAIITYAVHPDDLMLVFLKLRFPYKSVMVTSVATRFLPVLLRDAASITDAQRARGLDLDRGNLIWRVRHYVTIIVPLLSNSLDRAVQVAEAMEARGFGSGTRRTFYRRIPLSRVDLLTLLAVTASLSLGIAMRIAGQGAYDPYEALADPGMAAHEGIALLALGILLMLLLPLSWLKGRVDLD